MKKKTLLSSIMLICVIFIQKVNAQFVSTDNFVNINTNYFVTGSLTATNEQKYLISLMRISSRLQQEFAAGPGLFPSLTTYNGFKIYRGNYPGLTKLNCLNSGLNINFVFIRPNNTTPRRCILLTNGAAESLGSNWSGTLILAADLVMRGYAVAIYENFVSSNGIGHLIAANGSAWKYPCGTNTPCLVTDPPIDLFRKAVYSGVQCGIAALQTIMDNTNNSTVANVDTSKIYAMGASFGGITSMAFTYADDDATFGNVNFNNSLFSAMGGFTNISRWPNSRYKNVIKAVACMGGGTTINDPVIGNIFDNKDKAPVIFLHAVKDSFVTIDSAYNLKNVSDGRNIVASNNLIGGPAKINVINALQNNGIKYNVYVNCDNYAVHPFLSGYFNPIPTQYDFTNLTTLSDVQIINLYTNPNSNPANTAMWKRYMHIGFQILDADKYITDFFNKSTSNPALITNASKFIVPTTIRNATADVNNDFFPPITNISNTYPNGRYINSASTCINIPLTTRSNTLRKSNDEILISKPVIQKNKSELLLYPNPTTSILNCKFNVDVKGTISLIVSDINGKQINTILSKEFYEIGDYSKTLDISNFANGVYFITFVNGNNLITKSFSVLK